MKFDRGDDERYMALLSKCLMASGGDALFNAGGVDLGTMLELKRFSELAKVIAQSSGVAFELREGGVFLTSVGRLFVKLTKCRLCIDKVYVLEPYSQLIEDEVDWTSVLVLLRDIRHSKGSVQLVDFLNDVVDRIRSKAGSSNFIARLNSYHRPSNKNYQGLMGYEQALFNRYSKLLVLRIDLSYGKDHCKVSQAAARKHRERLFSNARSNKIFRHMLGYVTKLEHGVEKGFHFHCMFFFDGSRVREDITLARRIGDYWVSTITKGGGCYYNCNYAKEKYRRCGIGMVSHADMEAREGLRLAMLYLTKTDLYMKIKAEGRAFTKGVMPSAPSGRGRPRVNSRV